ncbi:MAG: hypothetical protein HZY76_04005 [Anaerolineae bacterium]|nr:MAG: hypothetical protein HZY76_04005 [Anaerolineae bacterium]
MKVDHWLAWVVWLMKEYACFSRDETLRRVQRLALPKLVFNLVAIALLVWQGPSGHPSPS